MLQPENTFKHTRESKSKAEADNQEWEAVRHKTFKYIYFEERSHQISFIQKNVNGTYHSSLYC